MFVAGGVCVYQEIGSVCNSKEPKYTSQEHENVRDHTRSVSLGSGDRTDMRVRG